MQEKMGMSQEKITRLRGLLDKPIITGKELRDNFSDLKELAYDTRMSTLFLEGLTRILSESRFERLSDSKLASYILTAVERNPNADENLLSLVRTNRAVIDKEIAIIKSERQVKTGNNVMASAARKTGNANESIRAFKSEERRKTKEECRSERGRDGQRAIIKVMAPIQKLVHGIAQGMHSLKQKLGDVISTATPAIEIGVGIIVLCGALIGLALASNYIIQTGIGYIMQSAFLANIINTTIYYVSNALAFGFLLGAILLGLRIPIGILYGLTLPLRMVASPKTSRGNGGGTSNNLESPIDSASKMAADQYLANAASYNDQQNNR